MVKDLLESGSDPWPHIVGFAIGTGVNVDNRWQLWPLSAQPFHTHKAPNAYAGDKRMKMKSLSEPMLLRIEYERPCTAPS